MAADPPFGELAPPPRSEYEMTQELGEDQEPAIRPAKPLNEQRSEVGWCCAPRKSLGIVVERPAASDQVDARLRVLDDRPVLDEYGNLVTPLLADAADVAEGFRAQEGIG